MYNNIKILREQPVTAKIKIRLKKTIQTLYSFCVFI
jgi:hypothetical protein